MSSAVVGAGERGEFSDIPVLAVLEVAAKLLCLSERKVWQMGRDGEISVERFGRAVRYRVREFLEKRRR